MLFNPINPIQMKSLILSCLCLSFFISTPTFAATTDPGEPLIVRSHAVFDGLEVTVANLEKATTTVRLINLDKDREVFSDQIRNHNGYRYKLQLDQLKHGRYLLKVKKGKTLRQQVLLVTGNGVLCSDWR